VARRRHTPQNMPISRHFSSGANRDRTGDLLLAKQALSQLSYGPAASSLGERRLLENATTALTDGAAATRQRD
jgi:hypothetical protein